MRQAHVQALDDASLRAGLPVQFAVHGASHANVNVYGAGGGDNHNAPDAPTCTCYCTVGLGRLLRLLTACSLADAEMWV